MFLAEAIGSVLAQTVQDFEVIVVDDASPEPPKVPDEPRVRLVRRECNGGPAAARNTGLDHVRGRHVAFLDDDDLFTPDRLEIALEGLERAPVAVCWNGYLRENRRHRNIKRNRVLEGDIQAVIMDHMPPHLGTTALRREAAIRFDERFDAIEDVEWWLRLARQAHVATVPRVGYLFRKHPEPRGRTGWHAHVRGSVLALGLHEEYFRSHPAAAAFRWSRIGVAAGRSGDYRLARKAFATALTLRPDAANAWHLLRSLRRSTARADVRTTSPPRR